MESNNIIHLKVSSKADKFSEFDNSSSHFRVKLPLNLDLNKRNMKIAVSSITFPNTFKILPPSINPLAVCVIKENLPRTNFQIYHNLSPETITSFKTIDTPKTFFPSIKNLLQELNSRLSQKGVGIVFKNAMDTPGTNDHVQRNECIIQSYEKKCVVLELPLDLAKLLGLSKDILYPSCKSRTSCFGSSVALLNRVYMSPNFIQSNKSLSDSVNIQRWIKYKFQNYQNSFYICLGKMTHISFHM